MDLQRLSGDRLPVAAAMTDVDKSQSQQVDREEPDAELGLVLMPRGKLDELLNADPQRAAEILRDLLPPEP